MQNKHLYLFLAILGTILPYIFFIQFSLEDGASVSKFFELAYANSAVSGLSMDLTVAAITFFVWSYLDAKKNGIKKWWLVLILTFGVGLSCAFPYYLYLKESHEN